MMIVIGRRCGSARRVSPGPARHAEATTRIYRYARSDSLRGEVMRLRVMGAVLLAILLAGVNAAVAQERYGSIGGTIMDTSPAPVPGATVTATNVATGARRIVVSG